MNCKDQWISTVSVCTELTCLVSAFASISSSPSSDKSRPPTKSHRHFDISTARTLLKFDNMDYETQEMYEYNAYHHPSQMNWMKCQNQSDWNQNVTEEMMNSYSNMTNTDLGFYCQQSTQQMQHCHQQMQQSHHHQQQYEYYEQQSYYTETKENVIPITQFNHLNHPISTLEGAATVQGQSINFQTSSLLDASQYCPLQMQADEESDTKKQHFYCTACNMRFSRLYHLKRHFESTGHKKCVIEANIEDPAVSLMNFYKNSRDSFKYYECQFCSKKYKNKISLKRHMNVHNDLKNALWCQYNVMQTNAANCCAINCQTS